MSPLLTSLWEPQIECGPHPALQAQQRPHLQSSQNAHLRSCCPSRPAWTVHRASLSDWEFMPLPSLFCPLAPPQNHGKVHTMKAIKPDWVLDSLPPCMSQPVPPLFQVRQSGKAPSLCSVVFNRSERGRRKTTSASAAVVHVAPVTSGTKPRGHFARGVF